MFAICSDLVDPLALNALVIYKFTPGNWTQFWAHHAVPLPTQSSCVHRVHVIEAGLHPDQHSVVVSELSTSKVFQIKLRSLKPLNFMYESRRLEGGFLRREFKEYMAGDNKLKGDKKASLVNAATANQVVLPEGTREMDDEGRPLILTLKGLGLVKVSHGHHIEALGTEGAMLHCEDFVPWTLVTSHPSDEEDDRSLYEPPYPRI